MSTESKYALSQGMLFLNTADILQAFTLRIRQIGEVGEELHTDSWIAGVVNPLQAPAVGVQTAPLVSSLLQLGAAATRRTEAVAAMPGQHGSSLSHNSCRTNRENKDYSLS